MDATIREPAFEASSHSGSHVLSIPNYPIRRNRPAYREWIECSNAEFEYIGFTLQASPNWWRDGSTGQQVAVKIREHSGSLVTAE